MLNAVFQSPSGSSTNRRSSDDLIVKDFVVVIITKGRRWNVVSRIVNIP